MRQKQKEKLIDIEYKKHEKDIMEKARLKKEKKEAENKKSEEDNK